MSLFWCVLHITIDDNRFVFVVFKGDILQPPGFLLSPTYKSWLLRVFQTNSPTDVTVVVDGYGTWGSCRSKVGPRIGGATGTCGNLRKSVLGMEVVMAGKIYCPDGNNNQVSSIFTTTIPRLQESCFFNMRIFHFLSAFQFQMHFLKITICFFWGSCNSKHGLKIATSCPILLRCCNSAGWWPTQTWQRSGGARAPRARGGRIERSGDGIQHPSRWWTPEFWMINSIRSIFSGIIMTWTWCQPFLTKTLPELT